MTITVQARAKINFLLKVGKKRSDGYHNIESIMQSVKLCDIIEIKKAVNGIQVVCDIPNIPCGSDNLAYSAAKEFQNYTGFELGIYINIKKKIPVAAGLAGGSADAAGVLVGLNELFKANLSYDELLKLALKCGSDVPFCIKGGTAIACGRGEKLHHYSKLPTYPIIIVKPSFSVSTRDAYEGLNNYSSLDTDESKKVISLLEKGDIKGAFGLSKNDLEEVIIRRYSQISDIKKAILRAGADFAMMSGSGSSVFGIFWSNHYKDDILRMCEDELLRNDIERIELTYTASEGVIVR